LNKQPPDMDLAKGVTLKY